MDTNETNGEVYNFYQEYKHGNVENIGNGKSIQKYMPEWRFMSFMVS